MANSDEAEVLATSPENSAVAAAWKTLFGLRNLQLAFSDPKVRRARSAEELADPERRQLLMRRLNQIEADARMEFDLQQEMRRVAEPELTTNISSADEQPAEETWSETWSKPQPIEMRPSDLLADARADLRQAVEALTAERAACEKMRQELEARLNEKLADSRMRADLEAGLDDAHRQLRHGIDTHSAELRARQDELKTAEAEYRQAVDTYASDRATWETTHEELKAALKHEWAQLRQTTDGHVSERASWADARQQLEAAVDSARADFTSAAEAHDAELETRARELREAADARATLEYALDAAQRERQKIPRIIDAHQSEQAAWNATRQELESRVGQIGAIGEARAELETALAESQTSLRQNAELYATERADWETRQQQLEAALNAAGAKLKEAIDARASEQEAWAGTRHHLESRANELRAAGVAQAKAEQALDTTAAKLQQTTDVYASDRAAWDATRQQLEADATRASAELAKLAEVHDAELEARAEELQNAADARTRLGAALAKTQAESQHAVEAHASDCAAWDATRQQLAIWNATCQQLEADLRDGTRARPGRLGSAARARPGHRRVLAARLGPAASTPGVRREAVEAPHIS